MAKKKETTEKIPKLILSEDEVVSLEQVKADDELLKKQAPKREKETRQNEAQVEELRKSLEEIKSLDPDSAEYQALKRKLSRK